MRLQLTGVAGSRPHCMAEDDKSLPPVTGRNDLVAWFEQGCKTGSDLRIGIEHEKIPFYVDGLAPVPYEGDAATGRGGIKALFDGLAQDADWRPGDDGGQVNSLSHRTNGASVTLEPGGQFELSGAPLRTMHEIRDEIAGHLAAVKAVAEPHGIGFLTLGASPKWTRAETPLMPKARYRIMEAYMPKVGSRGLDMMFRTATAQVNLDYTSEADMVRKLRVSLALQPVATALFANSPFTDGRPNGFLSARSQIWLDTDRARTGIMPFAFEPGMGFERFVDFALGVPMYFVKRDGRLHDATGLSFRDFLDGRLPILPGERPTLSDWADHLSTIFTEVRLKRYIEMRGEDVGPPEMIVALGALFAGLLYDGAALQAAGDLVAAWSAETRLTMREQVPARGFAVDVAGRSLREVARDMIAIAKGGLSRRGLRDPDGRDEAVYLAPLEARIDSGRTRAEDLLDRFHGAWDGNIDPVFAENAF